MTARRLQERVGASATPRLLAAAAALWFAGSALRTWNAERVYELGIRRQDARTGRALIDQPARDAPGRLEDYEEALRRDARQPLFSLRSAQILLQRAPSGRDPGERAALVETARSRLAVAAAIVPLDSRVHDALAHCRQLQGDIPGALAATRRAVVTGPRRGSTLGQAVARAIRIWRRTRDPDALCVALEGVVQGFEMSDGRDPSTGTAPPVGARAVEELLAAGDGPTLDEIGFAVAGRRDLKDVAVRLLRIARPDDADRLAESAR